ncbi:MAG: uroporphyrinogen decarboxylase family protein [Planctomycetota bacterium]
MTSRERVLAAIEHKEADRIAVHDSPWRTAIERWRKEGLPEKESPTSYFGYEFRANSADITMQLPVETKEDTDKYTVTTTGNGAIRRNWKDAMSTPELVGFTITTKALWEENKRRMTWNESRVKWEQQLQAHKTYTDGGFFRYMNFGPGFTAICNMVGPENLMIAMVEDPEWTKDMFMTEARLCVACAEEMMGRGFELDAGWIFDDLGHKLRSFFSPAMYRDQLLPAHKLICDCFKARGKKMILHSCGYVMNLIPDLIAAGFDVIQPLEVKAGNDMLGLKKKYGDRLAFMGGIDVRAMADPDPKVIEEEISSKIPAMKQGGGYIYHSDHSVPDNVSFQQYCRTMELVAEHGKYR